MAGKSSLLGSVQLLHSNNPLPHLGVLGELDAIFHQDAAFSKKPNTRKAGLFWFVPSNAWDATGVWSITPLGRPSYLR